MAEAITKFGRWGPEKKRYLSLHLRKGTVAKPHSTLAHAGPLGPMALRSSASEVFQSRLPVFASRQPKTARAVKIGCGRWSCRGRGCRGTPVPHVSRGSSWPADRWHDGSSEAEIGLLLSVIPPAPAGTPMTQGSICGDLGSRFDFFAAHQGIERNLALRVGVQGHPFPHLAVADSRGNDDLVFDLPSTRVDQLAGLVVGQ